MIRVVIVDDHELIREGIKKIIRPYEDIQVDGEAATLSDALEIIRSNRPDIIILDLSLPDKEGMESVEIIRNSFPEIPFLVLTMYEANIFAINALKLGAAGYVSKSTAAEELIEAIRHIEKGKRYISAQIADLLAQNLQHPDKTVESSLLTPREREVAKLIGLGLQSKQIAADLHISISSVNTYRLRIFRKLGIKNNASLIRYVISKGL